MRKLCLLLSFLVMTGCEEQTRLPPVVELRWQPQSSHPITHVVRRGETLYAVAFRYDKDFRQLAAYNHLHRPYALRVGQILRLPLSAPKRQFHYTSIKPVLPPRKHMQTVTHSPPFPRTRFLSRESWLWPAQGRVVSNFIPQQGKKGIDIAGKKGQLVRASAKGVVAYAGSGLTGYGNLIIIKHDKQFLTAYGNNFRNRVVEGQSVKAGQIIAEMGIVDRKFWGVHFEIRKSGQPVNPMSYLK